MSLPSLQEGWSTLHRFSKRRLWNHGTYLVPSMEKTHSSRFSDEFGLVPKAGLQSGDLVITKRNWVAFSGTNLERKLRQ
jgi:nicotinamidase-related amidase